VCTFSVMLFVGRYVVARPLVADSVNDLKIWICSIGRHVPLPWALHKVWGVGCSQEIRTLRHRGPGRLFATETYVYGIESEVMVGIYSAHGY
jgi:hypothetical protein